MKIVICHSDPAPLIRSALLLAVSMLPENDRLELVDDLNEEYGSAPSVPAAVSAQPVVAQTIQQSGAAVPPAPVPPPQMTLQQMAALAGVAPPTTPVTPPVAPPPAPVPVAPAAPPAGPERDVTGCPWDHRIHSRNKTKNQDGQWKRQKGIEDAAYNAIRAELMGTQVPIAPTPAPPAAPQPPAIPPAPPVAPAPPAPPAPPAAPAGEGAITFPMLLAELTKLQAAGRLGPEKMNEIAARYGVAQFGLLASHPQHWAALYRELTAS